MWDLWSEVQWWDEWQLRILVLGSLFLQFVLFISLFLRIHIRAFKSCMWLAYIGADAVAIYGLATLFNRHNKLPTARGGGGGGDASSSQLELELEVLWAPVLLLHLGGLHTFTAYSFEDNELWGRELVSVVSQVTVALYVFCTSWSFSGGDKKLLRASVLLFVIGILKTIQKTWALKAGSFNSLVTSSAVYPQRRAQGMIAETYISLMGLSTLDAVALRDDEDRNLSLEEYVETARHLALKIAVNPKIVLMDSTIGPPMVKQFVDLSDPYLRRLKHMQAFLEIDHRGVMATLWIRMGLSFLMIYTDLKMVFIYPALLVKLLLPLLSLASAVLFGQSHKGGYKEKDVTVTYILLWCTTLLAFLPFILFPLFFGGCILSGKFKDVKHTLVSFCGPFMPSIRAAQHSLLSSSTRRRSMSMKPFALIGLEDYITKHWGITHAPRLECSGVISLVHDHAKEGWKTYIVDGASYRRFNNLRGQWAISKHKVRHPGRLLSSLQVPFDHSVLVWHVATELCIHHPQETTSVENSDACRHSKMISNYMIYLLLIHPEMLLPGTRQALFTNTSDDMEVMLNHIVVDEDDDGLTTSPEGCIARRILRAAQSPSLDRKSAAHSPSLDGKSLGPWILKACELAEDLVELLDDNERWLLIQGVWVEMLCYSASRCRGYLHAKAMGDGVEFLTYVWHLWSQMGMETFPDSFQRPEPTSTNGEEIKIETDASDSESQPQASIHVDRDITIAVE